MEASATPSWEVGREPQDAATGGSASPGGAGSWWMIVAAAAVASLVLVLLAAGALWWFVLAPPGPAVPSVAGGVGDADAVPVAQRPVRVAVPEGARLWIDGQERTVQGGAFEGTLPGGHHAVVVASGEGCVGVPPAAGRCCARAEGAFTLDVAAAEPLVWEAPAPVPDEQAGVRDLEVTVTGEGVAMGPAVLVDGKPAATDGDRWLARSLPLGDHTVVVQTGPCPPSAAGCSASGTCPAGCASVSAVVPVACGDDVQAVSLSLPAPSRAAATTTATPAAPRPERAPRPDKPAEAPVEAPRPITVRTVVTGITVDKALDALTIQSAVLRQSGALETCYRGWLRGSAAFPKTAIVEFEVERTGAVVQASAKVVSSSGERELDACAIAAVRRSTMAGAKKAATGRVKVQFESYQ